MSVKSTVRLVGTRKFMILVIKRFLSFVCLLFVACVLCNSEAQSKQLNVYLSYMDTSDPTNLTSFYIARSFFCPPITELNLSTKIGLT